MKNIFLNLFFFASLSVSGQHSTYYVGHSGFGWDLIVGEMVNDLAVDAGIVTYNYGYQFIGGTCISNQWQSHATSQGGTDSWVELPTGNYDILVLAEQLPIQEVIYGSPWCATNIYTSVEAIDFFYDMAVGANPNTNIYLMEFHNEVDQTATTPYNDWINLNAAMRPLWEQVIDSVSLINSGPNVCIVPVAAAFQALADSVIAGSYPGVNNWIELFDPNDAAVATIHPTEATYYLVACVHFATLFGQSPVGLTNLTFAAAGWAFNPPTTAQARMMQEIAWNIVSNDNYTCLQTLATKELVAKEPLDVTSYPNPFSRSVTIEISNYHFQNAEFTLFDLLGAQKRHIKNINGANFILNREELSKGVYFYKLTDEKGLSISEKLIIE